MSSSSLFYELLTSNPETLQQVLQKRTEKMNQPIQIEVTENKNPFEKEFLGEDSSDIMIHIDEYMREQMQQPTSTDFFSQVRNYNKLNESLWTQLEVQDALMDEKLYE